MAITFYDLVDKDGRRYSPYGWRVRMALAHKGLDATVELCWHSDKEKLSFSGQHLVPVLRDGERAREQLLGHRLLSRRGLSGSPDADGWRAGARPSRKFLNSWMDRSSAGRWCGRSISTSCSHCTRGADALEFRRRREERNGATLEALHANRAKDFDEVNRAMLPLNELLRQQPFIAGPAPAYVDYIVFGTLQMPRRARHRAAVGRSRMAVIRWRDAMRKLFNGLGESTR